MTVLHLHSWLLAHSFSYPQTLPCHWLISCHFSHPVITDNYDIWLTAFWLQEKFNRLKEKTPKDDFNTVIPTEWKWIRYSEKLSRKCNQLREKNHTYYHTYIVIRMLQTILCCFRTFPTLNPFVPFNNA